MPESNQQSVAPQTPIAKYNLAVIAFFLLIMVSQAALARQYIRLFPADLRSLLNTLIILGFGVQSAVLIAVIPLAMVFIFGWLYLSNIQVQVRQLYKVVVLALCPLLLFMTFSLAYLLTASGMEPEARSRIEGLAASIQSEIADTHDISKVNPARLQELSVLVKDDVTRRWKPINRLLPVPLVLCCLTCGWLLQRRLQAGPIRSYLIPFAFTASVVLVRWSTAGTTQHLGEKVKSLVQP